MNNEAELLLSNILSEDENNGPVILTVNENTRTIEYDGELILGVEDDDRAKKIHFKMPKLVGTDDLIDASSSSVEISVIFKNAIANVYKHQCTDITVDGDFVTFTWLLTRMVTEAKGNVSFIVCVQNMGTDTDGNPVILNEWHTTPFVGTVLVGIDTDHNTPEVIVPYSTATTAKLINDIKGLSDKIDTTLAEYEIRIEDAIPGYSKSEIDAKLALYLLKTGGTINGDLRVTGEVQIDGELYANGNVNLNDGDITIQGNNNGDRILVNGNVVAHLSDFDNLPEIYVKKLKELTLTLTSIGTGTCTNSPSYTYQKYSFPFDSNLYNKLNKAKYIKFKHGVSDYYINRLHLINDC